MYEYDDASVSSNSEPLSFDVADAENCIKEAGIRSLKCGKAAGAGVTAGMIKYSGPRVLDLF